MTTSFSKNKAGFTLFEILLVLGLIAIFSVIAMPAVSGWRSEMILRKEAGSLINLVQDLSLESSRTCRPTTVLLAGKKEVDIPGVHVFRPEGAAQWTWIDEGGSPAMIRIDRRGFVDPVAFRVSQGERFIQYRFDFLTGHVREESSSF